MSGEFVCSADSLVYARGNAGTIKASFSWANNKKWLAIYSERTNVVERPPVGYEAAGE